MLIYKRLLSWVCVSLALDITKRRVQIIFPYSFVFNILLRKGLQDLLTITFFWASGMKTVFQESELLFYSVPSRGSNTRKLCDFVFIPLVYRDSGTILRGSLGSHLVRILLVTWNKGTGGGREGKEGRERKEKCHLLCLQATGSSWMALFLSPNTATWEPRRETPLELCHCENHLARERPTVHHGTSHSSQQRGLESQDLVDGT